MTKSLWKLKRKHSVAECTKTENSTSHSDFHIYFYSKVSLKSDDTKPWTICHTLLRANLSDTLKLGLETNTFSWVGLWAAPGEEPGKPRAEQQWRHALHRYRGTGREPRVARVAGCAVRTSPKELIRTVRGLGRRPQCNATMGHSGPSCLPNVTPAFKIH